VIEPQLDDQYSEADTSCERRTHDETRIGPRARIRVRDFCNNGHKRCSARNSKGLTSTVRGLEFFEARNSSPFFSRLEPSTELCHFAIGFARGELARRRLVCGMVHANLPRKTRETVNKQVKNAPPHGELECTGRDLSSSFRSRN
jgi:hypothetical protein